MSIKELYEKLTKEEAMELGNSGWWKELPDRDVALAQLQQKVLCMDFSDFHACVEKAIGRGVFSHEFVNKEHLAREIDPSLPEPTTTRKSLGDMIGNR